MNKIIYLGITEGCIACSRQKRLLEIALENCDDITLKVCNYKELPEWIKTNIKLTDFPVTILIKNNVIKYYHVGTMSIRKFNQLKEDFNF